MGQVCTKNDAGKVATDAPKQIQRGANRELVSSQKPVPPPASTAETKFVETRMNFNTDKTVAKKADEIAQDVANQWLEENKDWEYTGVWKNERSKEDTTVEISLFEVRKKNTLLDTQMTAAADVKPVIVDDPNDDVKNKRPVVDQKQSFVDQVSEGLEKKIPKERFEQTAPETPVSDEKKQEAAPAAEEERKEEEIPKQIFEEKSAATGPPPATGTPPDPIQDAKDAAGPEQLADRNSEAKDQAAAAASENAKEDEQPEAQVQEEAKAEPEEEKAVESSAAAQDDQEEAKADDEADGEEALEVEDPGNKNEEKQADGDDKEKDKDSVVDGLGAEDE